MSEPLTATERRVYHYLLDFLADNTYQPSIREIGKQFRIKSTKTVSDILHALAAKGYIERDASRSRGVRLLGFTTPARTQPIPHYERVVPGAVTRAADAVRSWITLDRRFVPSEDAFFLRVEGDSMIGRGIVDRDFVLVNPSARAKDGDLIAARIGDRSTVKTLQHRGAAIVLEAANDDERELVIHPDEDFAVLGTIVGIFRPLVERELEMEIERPDVAD